MIKTIIGAIESGLYSTQGIAKHIGSTDAETRKALAILESSGEIVRVRGKWQVVEKQPEWKAYVPERRAPRRAGCEKAAMIKSVAAGQVIGALV